jgi:hypothetical protein
MRIIPVPVLEGTDVLLLPFFVVSILWEVAFKQKAKGNHKGKV